MAPAIREAMELARAVLELVEKIMGGGEANLP
jgi:hypothetical protein